MKIEDKDKLIWGPDYKICRDRSQVGENVQATAEDMVQVTIGSIKLIDRSLKHPSGQIPKQGD